LSSNNAGMFTPSCSVVICTRNRPEELNQCLTGVSRLLYPRFDVLVVDNASADRRTREVARRWGARYVVEPVVGVSRARNCGARACEGEIVAYLDDDAVPESAWISTLVAEFRDPRVMAVSGGILPLRVETEAECLFEQMGGFGVGGQRWEVDRQHPLWFSLANFGGLGNEANMAFRRQAFDFWPGFDERLGRGTPVGAAEGSYALFSLIHRGYRIVHTPGAVVRHPYPQTMDELRRRYMGDLASATAYLTFLLVEEPEYRRATIQFIGEALMGTRRPWHSPTGCYRPRIVPRWRTLLAYLSGPFLYARSRFQQRAKAS
jgi:glycosyltransferase involved in cell wall biosynthesis